MAEDVSWRKYAGRFRTFPRLLEGDFHSDTLMIICIPVQAEPDLLHTLNSINAAYDRDIKTEVILLFNKNTRMTDEDIRVHDVSWLSTANWIQQNDTSSLSFMPIYLNELPDAKGGVGWARKIAMDEAARRLGQDGIIVCLDGDCTVAKNYIQAICRHFGEYKKHDAVSIHFEHQTDCLQAAHYDAIITYELHLRYLKNAQEWCGHPFSYYTVGSSMAVRRNAYMLQGGMNTRSAGEDFYFLQKFIEIGAHGEITTTTVFPSARLSTRVPFGTGRAMQQILLDGDYWLTTDFQIFKQIKPLFQSVDKLRDILMENSSHLDVQVLQPEVELSDELITYLKQTGFMEECRLILAQTAGFSAFHRRFFRYFNSFRMIKYMHFMRDHYYPDVSVLNSIVRLSGEMQLAVPFEISEANFLQLFRKYDREKE